MLFNNVDIWRLASIKYESLLGDNKDQIITSFSNVEVRIVEENRDGSNIEIHFFDTLLYGNENTHK